MNFKLVYDSDTGRLAEFASFNILPCVILYTIQCRILQIYLLPLIQCEFCSIQFRYLRHTGPYWFHFSICLNPFSERITLGKRHKTSNRANVFILLIDDDDDEDDDCDESNL